MAMLAVYKKVYYRAADLAFSLNTVNIFHVSHALGSHHLLGEIT